MNESNIYRDFESFLGEIISLINTKGNFIISIDGVDGTGKSTLAKSISDAIDGLHINLDKCIDRNQGRYVDNLRFDEVLKLYNNSDKKVIIFDGVCLMKILEILDINPNLKIYVRLVKKDGFWYKGHTDFNYTRNVDEIINEHRNSTRKMKEFFGEEIDEEALKFEELPDEIIRYHHEYKPNETCDYIYERVEV